MKFFEELKQRNVLRVAGAYAVAAWIIAQAIVMIVDAFGLPKWLDAAAIILLLCAFPVAVGLAWFLQWTPEGLRWHATRAAEDGVSPVTARRIDYAILGGLGVVIVMLAAGFFWSRPGAPASTAPGGSSIAVLPFVDMSPDRDQEYFSDGLTEELLNSLAQIEGLQVAGRTSSFAFKDNNRDLREIGQVLEVAHILEGSVRKSGDRLRITAQLIKADDGFHVWSKTFDTQLTDVFAVQDEITRQIVTELGTRLPGAGQANVKPVLRADLGAYDLFLLARDKVVKVSSSESASEAAALLDQAIAKEPGYVPALALRAMVAVSLAGSAITLGDEPPEQAMAFAQGLIDKALALDPSSPDAYHAQGSLFTLRHFLGEDTSQKAIDSYNRALSARPSFPLAQNDLGYQLLALGRIADAEQMFESALAHDPLIVDANINLTSLRRRLGALDAAQETVDRWRRADPDGEFIPTLDALIQVDRGHVADARRLAGDVARKNPDAWGLDLVQAGAAFGLADASALAALMPMNPYSAVHAPARLELMRGDVSAAVRAANSDPYARQTPLNAIDAFAPALYIAGRSRDVRAYFEPLLAKPGEFGRWLEQCYCSPGYVVAALQEAGYPGVDGLKREWAVWADSVRAQRPTAINFLRAEGDRLALGGDMPAAAKAYEDAIRNGWRDPLFIDPAMRAFAPDTPPMKAARVAMKTVINAERKKAGMPPL